VWKWLRNPIWKFIFNKGDSHAAVQGVDDQKLKEQLLETWAEAAMELPCQ
jgi:hypothetical protein